MADILVGVVSTSAQSLKTTVWPPYSAQPVTLLTEVCIDLVSLAIDEICDDGIILETDPVVISSRVSRPPVQDMTSVRNIDLSEQGLLNAWEFGKMKLGERLRQGLA